MMKVYVFGNPDLPEDAVAFEVAANLTPVYPKIEFINIKPNQDLPFSNREDVIILDVVLGISEPTLISDKNIDNLVLSGGTTVHDFDLGFQLKYLKKLGKLGTATIIGLPMNKTPNYSLIHSIFKKLVAQDIQGS